MVLVKLPGLSHRYQGLARNPPASHLESGTFVSLAPGLALWLLEAGGMVVACSIPDFHVHPSCPLTSLTL